MDCFNVFPSPIKYNLIVSSIQWISILWEYSGFIECFRFNWSEYMWIVANAFWTHLNYLYRTNMNYYLLKNFN